MEGRLKITELELRFRQTKYIIHHTYQRHIRGVDVFIQVGNPTTDFAGAQSPSM